MAHEEYKDMLPALALSTLDDGEARVVNQHLSECAECRRELADWQSTVAALALSASPAEPSRQVRDRIMGAVRSENQRSRRVVPIPSTQTRQQVWTAFGPVGAIAAAVIFLCLIIWLVVLWQQNRTLYRENRVLGSQIRLMEREIARAEQFVTILNAPGAKVTRLNGSGPGSGATAQFVYDRTGRAMLMADGLPPAPAGKEYQLWFIVGQQPPIPGRTFAPDELGRGELVDRVPERAIDSAVFAVTLEPAGGEVRPTGAIYLRSGK